MPATHSSGTTLQMYIDKFTVVTGTFRIREELRKATHAGLREPLLVSDSRGSYKEAVSSGCQPGVGVIPFVTWSVLGSRLNWTDFDAVSTDQCNALCERVNDSTYLQDPSSFTTEHPELDPLLSLQSRSIDGKVEMTILRTSKDKNVCGVEKHLLCSHGTHTSGSIC